MDNNEKIDLLLLKLEELLAKQQGFEAEINVLKSEVKQLQSPETILHQQEKAIPEIVHPLKNTAAYIYPPPQRKPNPSFTDKFKHSTIGKSDFEKFIGENLISKIGILILVIGVAIGAKLAIDTGKIGPLTRIILGYLVGVGLMGFAIKLKAKYESFSAVLLSGAIAILYFITYAAYTYYALIPQSLTFVLMVIFTGFTVISAIKYNKQVIAHIGLVGAYAIPFLLSDGSGKVVILFSYMAIINTGILVLAFTKYWKSLFYTSFALTWIIFLGWRIPLESELSYLKISILFSGIYFVTFYITNLAYKVIKKENFELSDVVILLLNSFIFYGAGYWVLVQTSHGKEFLGIFTLINAIIHFGVSLIIYKRKLADKNLFYFILALVITFITMAVPVQLNGSWVTIFWAVEAVILFYLGRIKNISIYEKLSFPLVFLAFFSLAQDWVVNYFNDWGYNTIPTAVLIKPFFNVNFLTGCIFIIAFVAMFLVSRKNKELAEQKATGVRDTLSYVVPSILIIVVYFTFSIEIARIFKNLYELSKIKINTVAKGELTLANESYEKFGTIWLYIYTLFFASCLTLLNLRKMKSITLAVSNVVLNLLVILSFLTYGLYVLSELREEYISPINTTFTSDIAHIAIRYIAYLFFILLISVCYQLSKSDLFKLKYKTAFDYLLYVAVLWILSSELLNILELSGLKTGYKLGLSILWGCYALALIILGLWKNKKYLRIGAIVLFGITLIKLFFYDISSLDMASKTIVFVSLGVMLLIISFLYNKYKHLTNDDVKAP
jgi:uncharacterized membrane protein